MITIDTLEGILEELNYEEDFIIGDLGFYAVVMCLIEENNKLKKRIKKLEERSDKKL